MPRYLIISIGIVAILLMLGMWGYLLMYGAPKQTSDIFSNLGVIEKGSGQIRTVDTTTQDGGSQLSLHGGTLEQLTTKAVAGFAFVADEPNIVRYAERGTGHVYEIDLVNSFDTQISLTTLPETVEAVFSPMTTKVVLTTYENYDKKVTLGTLEEDNNALTLVELPRNSENIAFINEDTLNFTRTEDSQTVGYKLDTNTLEQTVVFRAPLSDTNVEWGSSLKNIYISPKPTRFFEGSLYSVVNSRLTPKTTAQFGFAGFTNEIHTIYSYVKNDAYVTESLYKDAINQQAIAMFKEKCDFENDNKDIIWCAVPLVTSASYLEDWHKGTLVSEDYLWRTNLTEESSRLVGDLQKLSGRILDVLKMEMGTDDQSLLFTNKTDQTLWVYRIEQ